MRQSVGKHSVTGCGGVVAGWLGGATGSVDLPAVAGSSWTEFRGISRAEATSFLSSAARRLRGLQAAEALPVGA
jgi:hypothetical protein